MALYPAAHQSESGRYPAELNASFAKHLAQTPSLG